MQNGTNSKIEVDPVAQIISGPGTTPTAMNPAPTPNVLVSFDVKEVRGPAFTVPAAARLIYILTIISSAKHRYAYMHYV